MMYGSHDVYTRKKTMTGSYFEQGSWEFPALNNVLFVSIPLAFHHVLAFQVAQPSFQLLSAIFPASLRKSYHQLSAGLYPTTKINP